VGSVIGVKS